MPVPVPVPVPLALPAANGANLHVSNGHGSDGTNGHGHDGSRPKVAVVGPATNGHHPADGERWGPGRRGRRRATTAGPTTVSLSAYPSEPGPGEEILVDVEVGFVGGVKSIHIDYGDGTTFEAVRRPEWYCNGFLGPKDSVVGELHAYAEAGTYRMTAVVTTVDCTGEGAPRLPAGWNRPTRRDGSPARPQPLFPQVEAVGVEQVTTVTLTVTARPAVTSRPAGVDAPPRPDLAIDRR